MPDIKAIYYYPIDAQGKPTGQSVPVGLRQDGSADISGLPVQLQSRLASLGTPDELHAGFLTPKDGSRFLLALIRNSDGYANFGPKPLA